MTTANKEYVLRLPADDIPHTEDIDIQIPKDGTYIDVYSGHVPIALKTLTGLFSVREQEERVLLWGITHELIEEIARDEGWFYQDGYLHREYDYFEDTGELLRQHDASANRVFDQIWLLKDYVQAHGIRKYFENCQILAGDNEAAIETVRKEFIAEGILTQ